MKLLVALLVASCLLAVSCGGSSHHLATLTKTRACLVKAGVRFGGQLDFVASTANGGALKARLPDNDVTIVFGDTVENADAINHFYHQVRGRNIGIDDVLKQQGNVVMLWHTHPSDADIARVTGCLK